MAFEKKEPHGKSDISFLHLSNTGKRCFTAFLIMLLLFLPYLLFEPVSSDTNDDTAMNLIAAGAFSEDSQYLVYINVLYGYLLKALFHIMPSVNWYLYLALTQNFLSAALIGMCLAYFLDYKRLFPALIMLHFFIAGEFYQSVQFTRNGYLYAICGIMMLSMSCLISSYRKCAAAAGGIFLFLAFLVRMECFVPMAPFGLLLLLWCFIKNKRSCLLAAAALIITFAACGGAYIADQKLFRERDEWAAYFDYHLNGTSPILDGDTNRWFSFDAEDYDMELNDLLLLNEYQYADYSYFSIDRLKQLQAAKEGSGLSEIFSSLLSSFKANNLFPDIPDHVYFGSRTHYLLYTAERFLRWNILFDILLPAYAAYLIIKKRISAKELVWPCLLIGCMVFDLLAIIYAVGHTPRRATIGPRLAMEIYSLFVLIAADKKNIPADAKAFNPRMLIAPLAVFLFTGSIRILDHAASPRETETSMVLSELRGIEGEYYLCDAMILWGERLGITDMRTLTRTEYADFFEHFCLSGGWLAETPLSTHYMKEQGVTAPMTQLGTDPHSHYLVRSWKAEYLVPLMADYISRQCGCYQEPRAIYAGEELMIVDFYDPEMQ